MQQPDSTADQLGQFHEKVCISESNAAANREVLGRLQEELLIIQRLHKVLRPFLLRRTKEQVLTEPQALIVMSCFAPKNPRVGAALEFLAMERPRNLPPLFRC